jgi:hypothetical protein
MTPLNPKVGGTTGKGPGAIVARRVSWRVVCRDGLMQLASGRATRLESSVLAPPRGESPRRPPSRPTPAHPTQAWAMEGAGAAETADPTGAARVATLHCPHPAAAPGPPFPQPLGNRLPAHRPSALRRPPSPLSTPFHSPGDEVHILFGLGRKDETAQATSNPSRLLSTEPGQVQSRNRELAAEVQNVANKGVRELQPRRQ